jgi:hypothetical protein
MNKILNELMSKNIFNNGGKKIKMNISYKYKINFNLNTVMEYTNKKIF